MKQKKNNYKICAFGKTDIGIKRKVNEDTFMINDITFLVTDGMGGEAGGDIASQIFKATTEQVLSDFKKKDHHETKQTIKKIFAESNERILSFAKENPKLTRMGCTAELLIILNRNVFIGHIGDSRTYLLRNNKLKQLTHDHSLVQEQIDQGLITTSEAANHSYKNVILKAVGVEKELSFDLIKGSVINHDMFLLCSDGLTDMVNDTVIEQILNSNLSLSEKTEKLIETANLSGGYDNITIILVEIETD